jgi:pimeloyl-ACP methyl ester carboxylesterase
MSSSSPVHLPGITSRMVETPHGQVHLLETGTLSGAAAGQCVVFIHGNVSSSTFWEESMLALPEGFYGVAPDMRGYGESACLPVDATRGMRDFSDDIERLVTTLGLERFHLIGHSLGGNMVMQYTIDHPQRVVSLTLNATGSPYGFGGTRDVEGTPCWPDYAGSGGALVNPELHRRLTEKDRSNESDFSPRRVLTTHLAKPPFKSEREDTLLEGMLAIATGDDNYSRDMVPSQNWPFFGPGTRGVNNALSPKYCHLSTLADITPKPPILWVRGDADQVVADRSLSDIATYGAMGLVPNWPGEEVYPQQPMVSQIRAVLGRYQANGGSAREEVIMNVGHMPHLEEPHIFQALWSGFLREHA